MWLCERDEEVFCTLSVSHDIRCDKLTGHETILKNQHAPTKRREECLPFPPFYSLKGKLIITVVNKNETKG